MKIKSILFSAILMMNALMVYGQGTLLVDQESGPSLAGVGAVIGTNAPIGQSFTPTLNSIGYVALELSDNNPSSGETTAVYVSLLSGSITGTVLGSTTTVDLPPANSGYQNIDFFFPTAISLTPSTTYYFDVNQQSGTQWLVNYYGYEYAGGNAFIRGVAVPQDDLWFQEGPVPEPSVTWLALMGGGLFFCLRRWQKSPKSQP